MNLNKYTSMLNPSGSVGNSHVERRDLLLGGGMALLATGLAGSADAQEMASGHSPGAAEQASIDVVSSFCRAWERRDLEGVIEHFIPDFVYRMDQDTPPITGADALRGVMQPWIESSHKITYRVLETFARGPVVINHRIDIYHSESNPLTWEGVGVFLMEGDKIREWFDYTMSIDFGPTPA